MNAKQAKELVGKYGLYQVGDVAVETTGTGPQTDPVNTNAMGG